MTWLTKVAKHVGTLAGSPGAFFSALSLILLWLLSGPFVGYSDTWQLVINTTTTIITFLMVFVIQRSQNQDTTSIQIKLDELIRTMKGADNRLMDLEELNSAELEEIHGRYEDEAKDARRSVTKEEPAT